MAFTIPVVDDFKAQFARDFPWAVPSFGASPGTPVLTAGVISSLLNPTVGQGYLQAPIVVISDPTGSGASITATTVAQGMVTAWTLVSGGTGYSAPVLTVVGGSGNATDPASVMDSDITGALLDAEYNVNPSFFGTQQQWSRAYCYLAAHCLVEKLLAAGEGLRSRYNWLTTGKSVGDLSESFQIPELIASNPFWASLSKTRYGSRYLEIILPLCIGNMQTNFRITPP